MPSATLARVPGRRDRETARFNLFPTRPRSATWSRGLFASRCITDEMGFARDVGDRIVFMDSGVIVEEGPAKELVENPKEERTKRFLGLVLEH